MIYAVAVRTIRVNRVSLCFFFQAEDGIRDLVRSRGLGDVYKRQLYAHLSNYYVKPGDVVEKGAVIGAVGSTGNSTGPHLHFELRDFGRLVDPLAYLPKR